MTTATDLSLQSSGEFRRTVLHVETLVNQHALRTVADQTQAGLVREHQRGQTLHDKKELTHVTVKFTLR